MPPPARGRRIALDILALCFFCVGFAAQVFEIGWGSGRWYGRGGREIPAWQGIAMHTCLVAVVALVVRDLRDTLRRR